MNQKILTLKKQKPSSMSIEKEASMVYFLKYFGDILVILEISRSLFHCRDLWIFLSF